MLQLTVEQAMLIALEHHKAGRFALAEAIYRKILAHQPNHLQAHFNLGNALLEAGQVEAAIRCYLDAIQLHPGCADTLNNLGIARARQGKFSEAAALHRHALQIEPASATTLNNLGSALKNSGKLDEAIETFQHAIRLNPGYADAYCNLGNALAKNGDHEQAILCFREALRLAHDDADALNNMGVALKELGRLDEATALFEQAVCVRPQWASPHWNLAITCLARGDFQRGWAEYEWRWKWDEFTSPRQEFPQPLWLGGQGEDLRGRTILLHAEQGFGDAIQFVRYVPRVAHHGGRVILLCRKELVRLMQSVPGVHQVVTDSVPPFEVHCPLASLPLAFGTRMETIPAEVPYLTADAHLVEMWQEKVRASGRKFRVGLVWAGSSGHVNDRNRSIALAQLTPLSKLEGVTFFSLQKGPAAGEAALPPTGMELIDLTAGLHDFADTAALIRQLDLVISVDTAVAHLAGALGKPLWLLLPFRSDWRWLLDREDSPWYPTMRLFRQKSAGGWAEVIERVADAMRRVYLHRAPSERA